MKNTVATALGRELRCSNGLVAAAHPLAAAAGVEALLDGGNAVDAAVATALALTVVDPGNNSLGGYGGFLLVAPSRGEPMVVDFNTMAPLAAAPDTFEPLPEGGVAGDANLIGYRAITTPGVLAGLELARRQYGRLELERLLQPSIDLAANGFRVNRLVALCTAAPHMAAYPESCAIFRPRGRPLCSGERLVQGEYAETLRRIARGGPDLLYGGELGETVASYLQRHGGILSLDDMAQYRATVRSASALRYRGDSVASYPLETSGSSCVFETLNLVEGAELASRDPLSVDSIETRIAAMRTAWSDRMLAAGPRDRDAPSYAQLADKARVAVAQVGRVSTQVPLPEGHTTHLCAVDRDRNFVALTQTLGGLWFGSGVTVPGTGITLNCGMGLFDPTPGRRNSLAPGVAPLNNMSGSVVYRRGQPWAAVGTPGARRIVTMVVGFLLGLMEHGLSPQRCVESPRIHAEAQGPVSVERSLPRAVASELRRRGHKLAYHGLPEFYGPASAVAVTEDGELLGGSDPRFPGALVGY